MQPPKGITLLRMGRQVNKLLLNCPPSVFIFKHVSRFRLPPHVHNYEMFSICLKKIRIIILSVRVVEWNGNLRDHFTQSTSSTATVTATATSISESPAKATNVNIYRAVGIGIICDTQP